MGKNKSETKTKAPNWHSLELEDVLRQLKTDPEAGLAEQEILARQQAFGKNLLPRGKPVTALEMFLRQFKSPLMYILVIATALTWWIKEYGDAIVIMVVVLANATIGLFQEYRASKIFEKLKAVVKVEAQVIREGKTYSLDAEELVPGDVLILGGGAKIPADGRLISGELQANEAILTGESKSVDKFPGVADEKVLIGDRTNMVFMGTLIEQGQGRAVVAATGGKTEIGQITILTQSTTDEESPLQKKIGKLAGFLSEVFIAISIAIFVIGILRGDSWIEMFKTTIAVAVAAIPEGLPAVISIILAVSSKRILERKGLVRKLIAAETLGSTSVICADKTGTLTYGQMRVEDILAENKKDALRAMALANEAILEEKDGQTVVRGEATDKAKLEKFLESADTTLQEVLQTSPRLALLPFDPKRKYLASFHQGQKGITIYVSGAPEVILEKSTLQASQKNELQKIYENYAARGFRVIGLARKTLNSLSLPPLLADQREGREKSLTKLVEKLEYLGLAMIRDPVRQDVKEALQITRQAGIKILMITGDHALTAKAIGLELGFGIGSEAVTTGQELETLNSKELERRVSKIEIIARATPEHKMRIIDAWQNLGAVVAMTGDGVNDAPALKSADIGIAVGSGTDVAKEASDLVLLDDGFATITAAVREGRGGFANIKKATLAVMSNAFTEIVLITSALLFNTPFPITAIQILWVNIVTDGLPVLSLAFEPAEQGIMKQKPLSPKEPILNRQAKFLIFAVGLFGDLVLFGIFYFLFKNSGYNLLQIQSLVFVMTAAPTLVNLFAFKSLREPIGRIKIFDNKILLLAVAVGFALILSAIYLPALNGFLKTVPLPFGAAVASLLLFPLFRLSLTELTKWWYNRNKYNS